MVTNLTLNVSDYFVERTGQALPQITATVKDLGTFEALFFAFLVFVASVVIHEFAHWVVMLKYRPNAVILIKRRGIGFILQTGVEEDYFGLTKDQKLAIYVSGVGLGLLPILIAGMIHPLYYLVLPAYVVGTYKDMQLIFRELRK